jgi:hypothetical protein
MIRHRHIIIAAFLSASHACFGASLGTFSFTGTFQNDTDVQLFTFTLLQDTPGVALRTWSYVGGTNAAGEVIPGGGFEPYLNLFMSDGSSMNPGFITNCTDLGLPQDPFTGGCDISYPNPYSNPYPGGTWSAGTYIVALSLDANPSVGMTLSDGFFASVVLGLPTPSNFTCGPAYQGSPSRFPETDPFCSTLSPVGPQRTGNWALDILNVDSASEVPEPATISFMTLGVAGIVMRRRLHGIWPVRK